MKGMILFLTLLGAHAITNGAPATDHRVKVTVKRDTDCLKQFEDCKNSQKIVEECEKEAVGCALTYFTEDEIYKYAERFCSLPAFCGGAKKRYSELKRHYGCFEDFVECVQENEEQDEEIPLDAMTECQSEGLLCIINEHIETYSNLLEEGKAFCRVFSEQVPKEARDCDEELKECLDGAEDNEIAVAACKTNNLECGLESAR